MSSLKIETPRVSLPVRTPAQQSAPATASPGIVPPARTAPKADGFEKKRLPVAGSGGSVFGTSSTGAKASLSYIGTSGTKPHGGDLSQAVMDQLDQSASAIFSRLPELGSKGALNGAIKAAVDALGLPSRREAHAARRYLRSQVNALVDSGSGGSGNKHFGADVMTSVRPVDSTFTPSESQAPSTPTSRTLAPHRRALTNVARKLASDTNLQTDAHVRKAAWAEIKKLGLGEAEKQEARGFVLEQFAALRQGGR